MICNWRRYAAADLCVGVSVPCMITQSKIPDVLSLVAQIRHALCRAAYLRQ